MSHAINGRTFNSLLKVENVSFTYEERTFFGAVRRVYAVDGITLEIKSQEVIALVGESGCGKTTLGKVIVGLYKPTSGRVLYKGKDIWKMHKNEWRIFRQKVQLIHQDPYQALNPSKTVFQILSTPLRYHRIVKSREEARKRVEDLLRAVGLKPEMVLNKYPHQLSGGMRQRIVIARAISLRPELIVADEPVSMIDVSLRIDILNLLLDLGNKLNTSSIFITHDMGLARYYARDGRIAVMYLGNLVEIGPTEDVIQRPLHPYTKTLLSVVPVPDPKLARERKAIQLRSLDVPSASNPPHGCKFHTRCPFAEKRCSQEKPKMIEVEKNRYVACFMVE
ncbi:MAG: peptide ABC transporter ATP-binding protein [Deltaproteobacteria bacterium]|nr:MAG: peptide ABC transporter ATP-binding protein [Deltaproteobacteria bacterium]